MHLVRTDAFGFRATGSGVTPTREQTSRPDDANEEEQDADCCRGVGAGGCRRHGDGERLRGSAGQRTRDCASRSRGSVYVTHRVVVRQRAGRDGRRLWTTARSPFPTPIPNGRQSPVTELGEKSFASRTHTSVRVSVFGAQDSHLRAPSQSIESCFMSIEENKAIVGRWFTEFWGPDYNPAIIDEFALPTSGSNIRYIAASGRDAVRQFAADSARHSRTWRSAGPRTSSPRATTSSVGGSAAAAHTARR